MTKIFRAFIWYWIVAIGVPIVYVVWCYIYGIYKSTASALAHSRYDVLKMLELGTAMGSRDVNNYIRDGFLSDRILVPSVLLGMVAFIVVLLTYSLTDKGRANQ